MPKVAKRPQLTNRGPAGLLHKLPKDENTPPISAPPIVEGKPDNIAQDLLPLAVPISTLSYDKENARVHPERNKEAIRLSLATYGQLKPIVVRKEGLVVLAGNGTLEAAKELGWTKIAATIVDLSPVAAAGYGIADNRSAELARWDLKVVARISAFMAEQNAVPIGWSSDELEVLRLADWTPPAVEDDAIFDGRPTWVMKFNADESAVLQAILDYHSQQGIEDSLAGSQSILGKTGSQSNEGQQANKEARIVALLKTTVPKEVLDNLLSPTKIQNEEEIREIAE